MASKNSSYLLYEGLQEWKINESGENLESRLSGSRQSPQVEFSIPLSNGGSKSCPIFWQTSLEFNIIEKVDNKSAFKLSIVTNSRGIRIGRSVGVKCSLKILCDSSNALVEHFKSFSHLKGCTNRGTINGSWLLLRERFPNNLRAVRVITTYQVYDPSSVITTPVSTEEPQEIQPSENQLKYGAELAQALDVERKEGKGTDVILKVGTSEYKAHKLVLAIQSDFFKARFSDHWENNKSVCEVDMNDFDLNAEVLEALVSGSYTGKVDSFEMALKLLPATDKYQFTKLKEICEYVISCHMTPDNVLDVHLLAKNCNAHNLQKQCEFLVKI